MNWFDKYHVMRRLLILFYSAFLLVITYKIFCDGVAIDVFKVSIYVSFAGIITFMLKFYFDSRNLEIKGKIDQKIVETKLKGGDKDDKLQKSVGHC